VSGLFYSASDMEMAQPENRVGYSWFAGIARHRFFKPVTALEMIWNNRPDKLFLDAKLPLG